MVGGVGISMDLCPPKKQRTVIAQFLGLIPSGDNEKDLLLQMLEEKGGEGRHQRARDSLDLQSCFCMQRKLRAGLQKWFAFSKRLINVVDHDGHISFREKTLNPSITQTA